MDTDKETALSAMAEFSQLFQEAMDALEVEQENYWNSLSKEQQLMAFCAVVRRIYKGDIEDRGSYRYVLYQVFGFGPEAYAPAQLAGYLSIHNAIFTHDHESRLLKAFCTKFNIEDPENKIREFLL